MPDSQTPNVLDCSASAAYGVAMRFVSVIFLSLGFTVSGLAGSYSLAVIDLPKEQDVVAFTNGLPPSAGEWTKKNKADIIKFLRLGKYTAKFPTDAQRAKLASQNNPCEGVFTDRQGKFYFWTLITDDILWLRTPEGGGAVLEIRK